ncbi:MAG: enolase C-terminal domain-like protein [Hyphomonadaceae bacterium]
MRDSKLKITGDTSRDLARAMYLKRRGGVRLDANNLWPDPEIASSCLTALARHAWAIEEPIQPRNWSGLSQIASETGLAIILDESLLTRADLEAAPTEIDLVPNLRVSKHGGLLRSLDLLAHVPGPVIVGAQVGETSILARAGLALAHAAGSRLKGFEGAYAPVLLSRDVVAPSLGFGHSGRIREEGIVGKPGSGLALMPQFCKALTG